MVAQYNFEDSIHGTKTAIKSAFHFLLLEYGIKGEKAGEYSLDVDQFDFFKRISCHKIIRSGCEILFEEYGDETIDLYPLEYYAIEQLADFYDSLAEAMNKNLNQEK